METLKNWKLNKAKLTFNFFFQVWFSNRRAKWRRHHRMSLFRPYELEASSGGGRREDSPDSAPSSPSSSYPDSLIEVAK